MTTTQDNRLLAIHTSLGKDFLLINRLKGIEGISQLFSFDVEVLHEEIDSSYQPTVVDPKSIIGKGVTITIQQRDGTKREISGIVSEFSQGLRNARFSFYSAKVVPHIWLLTQKFQSRIFQNMSVEDILKKVFDGFQVSWEIQGAIKKRNYCVQYRESDFDFASRLMEEEGLYYYFEHSDGKHRMFVANTPQSHRDCPSKHRIPFFIDVTRDAEDFVSSVNHFWLSDKLQTGKVTFRDHNFQLPNKKLDHTVESSFTYGDSKLLELYDYPGGHGRKFDGSELAFTDIDKAENVKLMMESLDAECRIINGSGDCSAMTSGFRFELFNHPNILYNTQYVITTILHEAEQNPAYVSQDDIDEGYKNSFACIAYGAGAPPYRPKRTTAKPIVHGSQTAIVVGPPGEEIYTDQYGRVKVQFHWDRDGAMDESSSCWMRVVHPWAGHKWGTMFLPRIGMEVVVHFLEGDPDRPFITGSVYNPLAMPPYTLPDEKTKSTIKTTSSKGSSGFNELRFEDKKGSEQIFIHAEKNQDHRVKNDSLEFIGNDRHLIVGNEQFELVKKDKHLSVKGDQNVKVDGSISIKAGVEIEEKAGTKFAVDAGNEIHLKSGTSLILETGTSLTLKVGGNFININSGGIFIKGSMVFLNSGGAAGVGSGSNPDPPKQPKEADKADPGQNPELPPRLAPPPRPVFQTPAALVLVNAAIDGSTFCEICSR